MDKIRNALKNSKTPAPVLKHVKSMPLRNYPISNPIPIPMDPDYNPDSYYVDNTMSSPTMASRPIRTKSKPKDGLEIKARPKVHDQRKPVDRFVGHSRVGRQEIPNDVTVEEEAAYYDIIDYYAGKEGSPYPPDSIVGKPNDLPAFHDKYRGERGRVPAFPTKPANRSTPSIPTERTPNKKASVPHLKHSPSNDNYHSADGGKSQHSRFSKPLPAPPFDQNSAPPVPQLPLFAKINHDDIRMALGRQVNQQGVARVRPGPAVGTPVIVHRSPLQGTRGRVQQRTFANEVHGVVGPTAEIIREVDNFLVEGMSLKRGDASRQRRRL